MTLPWWLVAIPILIVGAVCVELYMKRGTKRPLSHHAANKRRWDDVGRQGRYGDNQHIIKPKWRNSRAGEDEIHEYQVSRDPQVQAKVLMPNSAKRKGK